MGRLLPGRLRLKPGRLCTLTRFQQVFRRIAAMAAAACIDPSCCVTHPGQIQSEAWTPALGLRIGRINALFPKFQKYPHQRQVSARSALLFIFQDRSATGVCQRTDDRRPRKHAVNEPHTRLPNRRNADHAIYNCHNSSRALGPRAGLWNHHWRSGSHFACTRSHHGAVPVV